jgi:hypothetical protein
MKTELETLMKEARSMISELSGNFAGEPYEPTNISDRKSQVLYLYFIFPQYDTIVVITEKQMPVRGSSHMPKWKRPPGQLQITKDVQHKE